MKRQWQERPFSLKDKDDRLAAILGVVGLAAILLAVYLISLN